jgi:cephalosporin hydroxylase
MDPSKDQPNRDNATVPEKFTADHATHLVLARSLREKLLNKIENEQSGVPTFFDKFILKAVENVSTIASGWSNSPAPALENPEQRAAFANSLASLMFYASQSGRSRFASYLDRRYETHNRRPAPWELSSTQWTGLQGLENCLTWGGLPLFKTVFDFAIYPMLICQLKPRTIIELGSGSGASAIWFADTLTGFAIPGRVISLDISPPSVVHPNATFLKGDCHQIEQSLPSELLQTLEHPWIVIEDAHVNMHGVFAYFRNNLKQGDYFIVEDSGAKHPSLEHFMKEFGDEFWVDTMYTDYFGRNSTCSADSIFVRK